MMIRPFVARPRNGLLASLLTLCVGDSARACAACFGDPDSSMAKGAVAGVIVLLGVIGFVLVGIAGTALFWMRRSTRIQTLRPRPSS